MIHRTLLLTHFFPPRIGGAEQYLKQLADGLPAGQLTVVAPPAPQAEQYDRTAAYAVVRRDLHRGWIRPAWLTHLPWLVRTIYRRGIRRLLFGHYAGSVGLGLLANLALGVPYAVAVVGLDLYAYRTTKLRRLLLRHSLRRAEWVVANSRYTAALVHNLGIPLGKIVVSHPGVESGRASTDRQLSDFRQAHRIPPGPMLLTVGRLVKRKGHARVIQALPAVCRQQPDATYVIVGDGPEREALERLARHLGIQSTVIFLGSVPDEDRRLAYQLADAFIMLPTASATDVEGFGIVYLEALAAGRPIIATRSGGVTDIIRHEYNGLAVNEQAGTEIVSQSITRLLSDQALAERLGQQGRRDVQQRFPISRQVAVFEAILREPPAVRSRTPLVSVVIPTYNSAATLPRTLHSLMVQTWKDTEIVVVDDGSEDRVEVVVGRFSSVRFVRQPHAGAAAARNFGFRQTQGAYVLFCDADVVVHPRMIERMVTTLELKPEAAYAYCSFRFGWRTFDLFDFDDQRLKHANYISTMSLIRREAFPGFDESLSRLQDWDVWLTMLERGQRGVWVPARLFSASVGRQGISRRISAPPTEVVEQIKRKHQLP